MFMLFFIKTVINASILLAAFHIVSRKSAKPDFIDLFYVSLAISFVSVMLMLILFPSIGYLVLVPIFAAGIIILIRFLDMSLLTAITVLIIFNIISTLLPF